MYDYTDLKDRRNLIHMYEFKNKTLRGTNSFIEVTYDEFYREIFGYDLLQQKEKSHDNKFNMIVLDYKKNRNGVIENKRAIVNDDLSDLGRFVKSDSPGIITNCISYIGKQRKESNARELFAFIIDLDYVYKEDHVLNLLHQFEKIDNVIKPTYIVNSGTGFHLYYCFEKPIRLYRAYYEWVRELQHQIQWHVWNDYTSERASNEDIQRLNITQGYRMIGTATKLGKEYRCTAFKCGDYFGHNDFDIFLEQQKEVNNGNKVTTFEEVLSYYNNRLKLKEAKELYPEWYQEVVVEKRELKKWDIKRDLYDWYLRQLKSNKSIEGSRYFRISSLATYARKCNIDFDEFRDDAMGLYEHLNDPKHDTPFTEEDLYSAIEFYNVDYSYKITRKNIETKSQIDMPATKRNGRTREQNLKLARIKQAMTDEMDSTNWRQKAYTGINGRKPKQIEVEYLLKEYPSETIKGLAKISGLSKNTIKKWKNNKDN